MIFQSTREAQGRRYPNSSYGKQSRHHTGTLSPLRVKKESIDLLSIL